MACLKTHKKSEKNCNFAFSTVFWMFSINFVNFSFQICYFRALFGLYYFNIFFNISYDFVLKMLNPFLLRILTSSIFSLVWWKKVDYCSIFLCVPKLDIFPDVNISNKFVRFFFENIFSRTLTTSHGITRWI